MLCAMPCRLRPVDIETVPLRAVPFLSPWPAGIEAVPLRAVPFLSPRGLGPGALVLFEAVMLHVHALEYAPPGFRAEREVVLKAVKSHKTHLVYTAPELRVEPTARSCSRP